MRLQYKIVILLILISFGQSRSGETRNQFERPGIGLEIGSWKPNQLKKESAVSPFGVAGSSPFFRLSVTSPEINDWTFRFSGGYWSQTKITDVPNVGSISIILLMLDLKQRIVPQSRLTPFVSYGVSFFVGNESTSPNKHFPDSDDPEVGYGANVGAGFDLLLAKHWSATIEFCYHYVRFNRSIGRTDDYSGPKISTGLVYIF